MHSTGKILTLALLAFIPPCWAAGPWLSETGGADMGLAGAGRAALALDAASIAANPAVMGNLTRDTFTLAVMPLSLDYDFHGAPATPAHAANHESDRVLPALYGAHRAGRLTYGLGVYSDFGLSFDSGTHWEGRRVIERAGIETLRIAPSLAWQATDALTVGAAIGAQWLQPTARLAVASDAIYYGPPAGLPDGQLELDGDSWAACGQLGATYALQRDTRLGLAWSAPVDHSVALDIRARHVHPVLATLLPPDGAAHIDLTVPQQVLAGLAHRTAGGTDIAIGANWQDWSAFGRSTLRMPGLESPMIAGGLDDTWGASIGARHAFASGWTGAAGIDYQSDPGTRAGVPAYLPVAEQWRLAAGVEHQANETLRLRAGVSVVLQGDADVRQLSYPLPQPGISTLTGQYRDTRVYLVSLAADFLR